MNMEVIRVVMEPVGIANRVTPMELFGEAFHHLFDTGNDHLIRTDTGLYESIVLLSRHRKNEPMSYDRLLRLRAKTIQMMSPNLGDSSLPFLIGKFAGCDACPIGIPANRVMQKAPDMNLTERFLGGVIHKSLQLLSDFFIQLLGGTEGSFSSGCLIEVFQIEPSSGRRLVREDETVLHESSSRNATA